MASHFDRDDVALSHMAKLFWEQSQEGKGHTEKFPRYQNMQEGHIVLKDIKKPEWDEWDNSLDALRKALQLKETVNQALLDVHKLVMETMVMDPQLCYFLELEYMDEQVKAIKSLGDHITNPKRLGVPQSSMGEYLFDKLTLNKSS